MAGGARAFACEPARDRRYMIRSFQPRDKPVLQLQDDKDKRRRIDRNGAAVADAAEPAAIGAVRGLAVVVCEASCEDAIPEQIVAI